MEPEMKRTRRNFTLEPKVTTLREHLVERVPVGDVCDKHHIHAPLFYPPQAGRRPFIEKRTAAFEGGRSPSRFAGHQEHKVPVLESKLALYYNKIK
jgi:transposase